MRIYTLYKEKRLLHSVVLLLLIIAALGCSKNPTSGDVESLVLANPYNERMFINIYPDLQTYYGDTGSYRYTVAANSELTVLDPPFTAGTTYVVDWYNTDYTISNWGRSGGMDFTPNGGNRDTYTLPQGAEYSNSPRAIWLRGGTRTEWQAVDVLGKSRDGGFISIANFLTPEQRYFNIKMRKDLMATYARTPNGGLQVETLPYTILNTAPQETAQLRNAQGGPVIYLRSNFSTGTPDNYSPIKDTMLLYMAFDTLTYYKMVRQ